MDPQMLARQIVPFPAPFLPHLLKAGEKAAEEAGKKLGTEAWEQAKALWNKLRGREKVVKVAETAAGLMFNSARTGSPTTPWIRSPFGGATANG